MFFPLKYPAHAIPYPMTPKPFIVTLVNFSDLPKALICSPEYCLRSVDHFDYFHIWDLSHVCVNHDHVWNYTAGFRRHSVRKTIPTMNNIWKKLREDISH